MSRRELEKDKISLYINVDQGYAERTFTIKNKISEGGSVIVYEAFHEGSGTGVLREFYPDDFFILTRDSGKLIVDSNPEYERQREEFIERRRQFISAYDTLQDIKKHDDRAYELQFIPEFEILYSVDESKGMEGTVYVWSPSPKVITFEEICRDIHENPTEKPEYKLALILGAIKSLAERINILHDKELFHRDIKPSNFGYALINDEALTQTIQLFDIDTVCKVENAHGFVGTPDFSDPLLLCECPEEFSSTADIYSIGVTLFYAIIISEEVKREGYIYRKEYYSRLREMVKNSDLIACSEHNSHPRLRDYLTIILEKCLVIDREKRYQSCDELFGDIERALHFVLPPKAKGSETWTLKHIEKELDKEGKRNSWYVLLNHLFKRPLYECISPRDKDICVFILGFGNYGQKFMDICLQMGQLPESRIYVSVYSDSSFGDEKEDKIIREKRDKESYLNDRPNLKDYFIIDGNEVIDPFGWIDFHNANLLSDNKKENYDIITELFDKNIRRPNYVFIALGDDGYNTSMAEATSEYYKKEIEKKECVVFYAYEGEQETDVRMAEPISMSMNQLQNDTTNELERMAFNAHLVWGDSLDVDFEEKKKEFLQPYYHDASLSYVVSMKYKLHSMGIDIDKISYVDAADAFNELFALNKRTIDMLVWAEHRRWVTEKLCEGYSNLPIEDAVKIRATKNEKKKQHLCIVRSFQYRESKYFKDKIKWNIGGLNDEELNQLDPLDKMSVELHRAYQKEALPCTEYVLEEDIRKIQKYIKEDDLVYRLFLDYADAAIAIVNKAKMIFKSVDNNAVLVKEISNDISLFREVWHRLRNRCEFAEIHSMTMKDLESIQERMEIILKSLEYEDYKLLDLRLIRHIPFILSYSEHISVFVPLENAKKIDMVKEDLEGEEYSFIPLRSIYDCISSSVMINPEELHFLYHLSLDNGLEKLQESNNLRLLLEAIARYMRRKNPRIYIYIHIMGKNHNISTMQWIENFDKNQGNLSIVYYDIKNEDAINDIINKVIYSRSKTQRILLEKNNSELSELLEHRGYYRSNPSFKFDQKAMKYEIINRCEWLSYIIKSRVYFQLRDIPFILGRDYAVAKYPEFKEDQIKYFWQTYKKLNFNTAWKGLCEAFASGNIQKDVLLHIEKNSIEEPVRHKLFYFPSNYIYIVSKIVQKGVDRGIFSSKSRIIDISVGMHAVYIEGKLSYVNKFEELFGGMKYLDDSEEIRIENNEEALIVTYNGVSINGVPYNEIFKSNTKVTELNKKIQCSNVYNLLNSLWSKGYIHNFSKDDKKIIKFTYGTKEIQSLLTKQGRLLELYAYWALVSTHYFDEVINEFTIYRPNSNEGINDELDCMAIKGMKTLIVECKAVHDFTKENKDYKEFTSKLSRRVKKYGINGIGILLVDCENIIEEHITCKGDVIVLPVNSLRTSNEGENWKDRLPEKFIEIIDNI